MVIHMATQPTESAGDWVLELVDPLGVRIGHTLMIDRGQGADGYLVERVHHSGKTQSDGSYLRTCTLGLKCMDPAVDESFETTYAAGKFAILLHRRSAR
jgi:hypothetical protein